jgi:hypothetical protein
MGEGNAHGWQKDFPRGRRYFFPPGEDQGVEVAFKMVVARALQLVVAMELNS